MGRPGRHESELVRVVRTGADTILTVVGAAPAVYRIVGTKPNRMLEFVLDDLQDVETFAGGQLWPSGVFTPDQLIYGAAWIVGTAALPPVDVLLVYAGATKYGTARQTYYLWQRDLLQALTVLSVLDVRAALASPWVQQQRTVSTFRGIVLR